ncbi:T9SS type A sorting domain-containing protein [Candidatus Latescibacterota bacterium]
MKKETKMKKLVKYFITCVSVILINNTVFAQTEVGGVISDITTWTLARSPYIVVGNILVMEGVSLTIEPGVEVKFDIDKSLMIEGELIAKGTESNMIIFTSNQVSPESGDWGYILFADSSIDATYDGDENYTGGCILEYCIVEYAGGSTVRENGAIRINFAFPLISYSTVRNNTSTGIFFWNPTSTRTPLPDDTLRITNCTIHNNDGSSPTGEWGSAGGINVSYFVSYGNTTIISNNTIYGNIGLQAGGIYIEPGYQGKGILSNNKIYGNTAPEGGGIYLKARGCNYDITYNIIHDNISLNQSGGGIFLYPYEAFGSVANNIICNNTTQYYGGGIYVFYEGDTLNISNNIFANNMALQDGGGLYINNYYHNKSSSIFKNLFIDNTSPKTTAIHDVSSSYASYINYNSIFQNKSTVTDSAQAVHVSYVGSFNNNNIYTGSSSEYFYELWNSSLQSSNKVDAQNNWWGTSVAAEIPSKIWDYFDDGSLGIVDYNPHLESPDIDAPILPPTNVAKSSMNGYVQLMWGANSEMDVAGYKIYYGSPTGYSFENVVDVGNVTNYMVSGVSIIDTIAVTAYDIIADGVNDQLEGHESWFAIATLINTVLVDDKLIGVPTEFGLGQNYPNPFNPITKIEYGLPQDEHVKLSIYNISGQVVSVLKDEHQIAGNHSVNWNATGFPSGLYFFILQTNGFTQTRKMILVK